MLDSIVVIEMYHQNAVQQDSTEIDFEGRTHMHPLPLNLVEQIGQILGIMGFAELVLIGGGSVLMQMVEAREDLRLKAIQLGLQFGVAGGVHILIGGILYRLC